MKRFGLLTLIAIAIATGIPVGLIAPVWLARAFATFNSIFANFLGFLIPLIIVGFVTPAIAEIGSKAGKMLVAPLYWLTDSLCCPDSSPTAAARPYSLRL